MPRRTISEKYAGRPSAKMKFIPMGHPDQMLTFAISAATMPGGKGWKSCKSFTTKINNALSIALYGIVYLVRRLVSEVLPGIFRLIIGLRIWNK